MEMRLLVLLRIFPLLFREIFTKCPAFANMLATLNPFEMSYVSTCRCPLHRIAFEPVLTSLHTDYCPARYTYVFGWAKSIRSYLVIVVPPESFTPPPHTYILATLYCYNIYIQIRLLGWVVNGLLPNQIRTTTIPTSLRQSIA